MTQTLEKVVMEVAEEEVGAEVVRGGMAEGVATLTDIAQNLEVPMSALVSMQYIFCVSTSLAVGQML